MKNISIEVEIFTFVVILALVVALILIVYFFMRDADKRRQADYRLHVMRDVLPNRLQAYERLSLYLNRITPDEMAVREQVNAASAKDLYLAMINCVRQEYEHNAAMQIYVTDATWKRVTRAKEEVLKTLGDTVKGLAPNVSPLEFSAEFVEAGRNTCSFYLERAKDGLRKDVAGEFVRE